MKRSPLLMREYGGMVHAVARRVVGTVAEADDVAQDTFLAAHRAWPGFRGDAAPATWLYRIAIRVARRQLRKKARRRERAWTTAQILPFNDARLPHIPDDIETRAAKRLRMEARESVNDAMSTLPTVFRIPVVLKDIAELSMEEIAVILQAKPATVTTRVHRGRLMLRAALLEDAKRTPVAPPVYERSKCLDLLRSKMDALDRRARFAAQTELPCERCRMLFASLDLAFDACRHAAEDNDFPPEIRRLVLAEIGSAARPAARRSNSKRTRRAHA